MQSTAKLRHLRIAPRKVRLVADLVRGKRADSAQNILNFTKNRSAKIILKLLNQALANAKNNLKMDDQNLFISKITVDGGPILKRFRPRARGSAYSIHKKTSHITIILDETADDSGRKQAPRETAEQTTVEMTAPKTTKAGKPKRDKFRSESESAKSKTEGTKQKIFRRQVF